jgi:hypothetical protein
MSDNTDNNEEPIRAVDIEMVISQTGATSEAAHYLLKQTRGDVVNAILHFFGEKQLSRPTINQPETTHPPENEKGELDEACIQAKIRSMRTILDAKDTLFTQHQEAQAQAQVTTNVIDEDEQ